MTALLLAMFLPMIKAAAYLLPCAGLSFGESQAAFEDERYSYVKPTDCGVTRWAKGEAFEIELDTLA